MGREGATQSAEPSGQMEKHWFSWRAQQRSPPVITLLLHRKARLTSCALMIESVHAMISFDFPNNFVKCVLVVSSFYKCVSGAQERRINVPGLRGGRAPTPGLLPQAPHPPLYSSAPVPASLRAGSNLCGGPVPTRHQRVSLAKCNFSSAKQGNTRAAFLRCHRGFIGFGQSSPQIARAPMEPRAVLPPLSTSMLLFVTSF